MLFTKYIPVPGKIEIGDITFWDDDIGYFAKQFVKVSESFLMHGTAMRWKKFELRLCSNDIQAGDKVTNGTREGVYVNDSDLEDTCYVETALGGEECVKSSWFKILGKISPAAIWIKEGMKFEEKDVRLKLVNQGYKIDPELLSRVPESDKDKWFPLYEFRGPDCGCFH